MKPPVAEPGYENGELPDRVWDKIDDTGDCWIWTAGTTQRGYGTVFFDGRKHYVHRAVYEALVGEIPPGQVIDHVCHTKRCCNPAHLRAGDQVMNMRNRRGAQTNSQSGIRGVYPFEGGWRVQAKAGGKIHSGGVFSDIQEAAAAAEALRTRLHA